MLRPEDSSASGCQRQAPPHRLAGAAKALLWSVAALVAGLALARLHG